MGLGTSLEALCAETRRSSSIHQSRVFDKSLVPDHEMGTNRIDREAFAAEAAAEGRNQRPPRTWMKYCG